MAEEKEKDSAGPKEKEQTRFKLIESMIKEASVPKIAHEFRTRLSIMRGALENVVDGIFGSLNNEQDKQLRLATESVERMTELVEDLMTSFSDRAGTLRLNIIDVPVQSVIDHAVDSMYSEAIKEGVSLMVEVQGEPLHVRCDPSKIEQVIINLLRNSIKFTSRGGFVTVKAQDTDDRIAISILDTGVGIPQDKLKEICGKPLNIEELKDASGGFRSSGLGLIIVREIVDAHKGEITISSEIGKGTSFSFTLPKS